MKRITAIILIAAACMVAASPAQCRKKTKEQPLRILYWNIQNGMWHDQGNNYDNFVKWVGEQNPDICVWCEAKSRYRTGTAEKMTDEFERYLCSNWDELAARYGHSYVYVGGEGDTFPQVITSKYPIRNVKRIVGEPGRLLVSHGCGWAQVDVNGRTINIVTLHTWPQKYAYLTAPEDQKANAEAKGGDRYRAAEVQYIVEHTFKTVPGAEDQLWMMLGDFNAISRVDNYHYGLPEDATDFLTHDYVLQNTPYIDVIAEKHPGEYHSSTLSGRRIDIIYMTRPLYDMVTSAEIPTDGWVTLTRDKALRQFCHPSDHRPVIVDLMIK